MNFNQKGGARKVFDITKNFTCKFNPEVDDFLHNKAWDFAKKRIASTYLVFSPVDDTIVLVGYFALSHKYFQADPEKLSHLSKTLLKRIDKFTTHSKELNRPVFSAPLIGQIGKNYNNGYDNLIKGKELLHIACKTADAAMRIIGGKMICLECENKSKLVN